MSGESIPQVVWDPCCGFADDLHQPGEPELQRRNTLVRFVENLTGHKDYRAVKAAVEAWFHEAKQAEWRKPADVKEYYGNASIVGADRVVFNIKGNDHRLVAAIDYRRGIVFIKWLGSHKEYDRIDVRTVQYADQAHQE